MHIKHPLYQLSTAYKVLTTCEFPPYPSNFPSKLQFLLHFPTKAMKLAFALLGLAVAFTDLEVDKGRACMRLSFAFKDFYPTAEMDLIKANPHLNARKLKDKLQVDVFESCRKEISESDTDHVKTSQGNFSWTRLRKYLHYDPHKYSSEADLEIPYEHLRMRKAIMLAEGATDM